MTNPKLFDVPPDRPSRTVRLSEFKRKHNILTHHAKHLSRDDEPWMALLAKPGEERHICQIMAEECRLYDEAGRTATGTGELSAIRKLCDKNNIPCDL